MFRWSNPKKKSLFLAGKVQLDHNVWLVKYHKKKLGGEHTMNSPSPFFGALGSGERSHGSHPRYAAQWLGEKADDQRGD